MSDEKLLGAAFGFIPRRLFAQLLAVLACAGGGFGIAKTLVIGELPGEQGKAAWQTADHCVGHACRDVLTCAGTRKATFHFREIVTLVGSTLFGYWGVLGAWRGDPQDLVWFAGFLFFMPVLLTVVAAFDAGFVSVCSAYPLNVIDEALLWQIPHWPIREVAKVELREAMVSYPVSFVNQLAGHNAFALYAMLEMAAIGFFAYAGHQVMLVAQFNAHGAMGMGPTYDVGRWHENTSLRSASKAERGYGSQSKADVQL